MRHAIALATTLLAVSTPVGAQQSFVRINGGAAQRAPAVVSAADGFAIFWIEEAPGVPRAMTAALWDGVSDTVTITGVIKERFSERPPEYRSESRVGHYRYPGVSVVTQVATEMNHPERQSFPAWDKATWSAHRGSPVPGWDGVTLGGFEIPYMSGRAPYPAGGLYFHTSQYDPARNEVVLLAAEGLDDLVLAGMPAAPSLPWRFTLPMMSPAAIVPVAEREVIAIFGDSLVRVDSTGSSSLPRRLAIPVRRGDPLARLLDESFLHLRIDSTVATMRRYSLDGELRASVRFRVPHGLIGAMIAQRPSDSAIAIVASDGSAIRLTLFDRTLAVRVEDSVLVRSDGDVRAPQASFIDGELVVAWEDVLDGDPDIAIARTVLDDVPAALPRETVAGRAAEPFLRVLDPVVRDGRLTLEVARRSGAPIAVDLVDTRGRIAARSSIGSGHREVIELAGLPPGVYVLCAVRSDEVVTQRFVIVR